jgi:hypothetical protein
MAEQLTRHSLADKLYTLHELDTFTDVANTPAQSLEFQAEYYEQLLALGVQLSRQSPAVLQQLDEHAEETAKEVLMQTIEDVKGELGIEQSAEGLVMPSVESIHICPHCDENAVTALSAESLQKEMGWMLGLGCEHCEREVGTFLCSDVTTSLFRRMTGIRERRRQASEHEAEVEAQVEELSGWLNSSASIPAAWAQPEI